MLEFEKKKFVEVYAMLKEGSERARAKAAETLRDVRHAMQIDYFG